MADRNVAGRLETDILVLVHHPAGKLVASLDALDNDYADTVAFVMYNKIYHSDSPKVERSAQKQYIGAYYNFYYI